MPNPPFQPLTLSAKKLWPAVTVIRDDPDAEGWHPGLLVRSLLTAVDEAEAQAQEVASLRQRLEAHEAGHDILQQAFEELQKQLADEKQARATDAKLLQAELAQAQQEASEDMVQLVREVSKERTRAEQAEAALADLQKQFDELRDANLREEIQRRRSPRAEDA